jgi:glycerol-3-phosphate acyltransferase PlsY
MDGGEGGGMHVLIPAAAALASYLLGAVPFGFLVVKLRTGQDVRTLGSGNIGATNVARALGRRWFFPVFALDFLKGFAPVFWLAPWTAGRWPEGGEAPLLAVVCGVAAMSGHLWPVYIGFRGGKGVATVAGILFALNWMAAVAGTLVWVLVFLPFRYVSLGSVVAALAVPVAHLLTAGRLPAGRQGGSVTTGFLVFASALVVWRHRENLGRLVRGEEKRMGGSKA